MPTDPGHPDASRQLSEAEVVFWLKRSLQGTGLGGGPVTDILVDADPSYLRSPYRRQLQPTGTVWIGSWRPDLVCTVVRDGTTLVAGFEVKAWSDYEKGIVQASRYRSGVHESYLCIPSPGDAAADWMRQLVAQNGVGLALATASTFRVEVLPAGPVPDPRALYNTERYLLGESTVRALGLNKSIHYAAATFAFAFSAQPWHDLVHTWGLGESATRAAVRGAETLGLLGAGVPSLKGRAFADVLSALGFDLATFRPLTRVRLADHRPGVAALLRSVLLEHPPTDLIVRVLAASTGPLTASELARRAQRVDPGMARATFGEIPPPGERWTMRPSSRYQLKAAMYDAGILDSPLAKGAGGGMNDPTYSPEGDIWSLSPRPKRA